MRRLLERGVYFTLTSTKQIRRVVYSRSKIENRVCEYSVGANPICADVVYSLIAMSPSRSGPSMLASRWPPRWLRRAVGGGGGGGLY